ncbi:MAG: hypothetical protein SVV80_04385 [Planctomycetota bacterium]|nr:hypothetical protein [Planctomycetota bacterium]
MSRKISNTQLFALPAPPAAEIRVGGVAYRLLRVFKHDFFAATAMYEAIGSTGSLPVWVSPVAPSGTTSVPLVDSCGMPSASGTGETPVPPVIPKIVVKTYRAQPFFGLAMDWLGRFSREHEKAIYEALEGAAGVPRFLGCVGPTGLAVEYIDAVPLDHLDKPPAGYFDRMRQILDAVHARGVAYVDANKLSNMLVSHDGSAHLIDFQIAIRRRDDWPWPMRAIAASLVRYLQGKDIYHLCKQKRRLAPDELTDEEEKISRRRGMWHRLHRKITKPYRAVRRDFLRRRYRAGKMESPSAELEDHHQPEKQTWRAEKQ